MNWSGLLQFLFVVGFVVWGYTTHIVYADSTELSGSKWDRFKGAVTITTVAIPLYVLGSVILFAVPWLVIFWIISLIL